MLCKWDALPKFMRTEEVRPYYQALYRRRAGLAVKRTFDFAASSVLLALLAPLFLFLAVLVKLDSKGPVFYRQERVTQYGRKFFIWKFRTMVQDAERLGSQVTVSGDARLTRVGKFIRDFRIDELPQLVNVLRGEMSFVGTRPEVVKYVKGYTKEMRATLLLPAGITSRASICYKDEGELLKDAVDVDEAYIREVLPEKMGYNLEDLRHFSYGRELMTMVDTVLAVLR